MLMAQIFPFLNQISRGDSFSVGKELDVLIKAFLGLGFVQVITGSIRWFFNIWVLVPTEQGILYLPTFAVIFIVSGLSWLLGGWRSGVIGFVFFTGVAVLGWWDRAMLTLHATLTATLLAMLLGMPLAIWAARRKRRSEVMILICDIAQTFPSFIYLLPAIMLFASRLSR